MGRRAEQRKLNVVIIENNPTYLKVWEKIFSKMPECSFSITNDPSAAKNLIKTIDVDLLVSEIVLPTIDGYSIARLAHEYHPSAEILLTTAYDCDLTRFDLKNPHFGILYKPYNNIEDIERLVRHLLKHEDATSDASEDSFSENESYPEVMEWKL